MTGAWIMLIALGLDALFGWPPRLMSAVGHPVVWIGRLIAHLDRRLNLDEADDAPRRIAGIVTACVVIGSAGVAGFFAAHLFPPGWPRIAAAGVLAWPLVATRSLHDHVRDVARPLAQGDLAGARIMVARIVGRDPNRLDRAGVGRAALESLAENTSDGIVAPVFWGVLFGLPGIAAYKAINTLDSMIGHRNARYAAFGWASARIDDVANLIPARATGALFALVSSRPRAALAIMWRDAGKHRSPNAGWPEAAMAGALGLRLSGPRVYGDRIADEPWVNAGAPDPGAGDIGRGLALYLRAMLALALIVAICAVI